MGGSNTLNEGESHMVYSSVGGQVKSTAVARLYMSQGNTWAYSHLWGAAALVAVDGDAGAHYIRLVDLQSGQVTWEQELYDRFEYQSATPFFHTFEGNDAVIGLSFADESDAATFHAAVASFGSAAGVRGGPPAPARRPTNPTPAARSPPATPTSPLPTPSAPLSAGGPPPALQRAPSSATNIQQTGGGGSMIGGQSAFAGTASGGGSKRMANPKQKKKGWFSRITEKMGLGEDEGNQDIVLSGPTGFRHESHIGWDPSNGFEIRNIPPEWRKLFQAAGVKKSELRDANTAKFIMDTVAEATMGANPMAGPMPGAGGGGGGGPPPPPVPGHRAPPPAPGAPPPPPAPSAPPPPPAFSAPSAPPPPSFGGPGAPPPPPPDKSMSFGSSLADQLASAQLKSAEDRAVPDLAGLNEEQSSTLADTLAKAMAARRVDMRADEDELDSDDEWSD